MSCLLDSLKTVGNWLLTPPHNPPKPVDYPGTPTHKKKTQKLGGGHGSLLLFLFQYLFVFLSGFQLIPVFYLKFLSFFSFLFKLFFFISTPTSDTRSPKSIYQEQALPSSATLTAPYPPPSNFFFFFWSLRLLFLFLKNLVLCFHSPGK